MVLVERALTEQHDELDALERAGPAVEVVVGQPAAGQVEPLVEPAELVPDRAEQNRLLLSPIGPKSPRPDEPAGVPTPNSR